MASLFDTGPAAAKIRALAPWFGGKRTMAPLVVAQLGKHGQYFEPFCGSMAVLFAKQPSQKETVNDLHGDLINLARILQDAPAAEALYDRLQRVLFSEDLLDQSAMELGEFPPIGATKTLPDRAYWYFLASWMGRNGTAGTADPDYHIAVRWTKGGGSPTVRWRNALDSIPWWHERLKNVVILKRDAFEIMDRFEDVAETAIYADPPYHADSRAGGAYKHDLASDTDHARLASILSGYKKARVVVSYYDCPRIRELYQGWTFIEHTRQKHLHAQNGRGARPKEAPEVLILNGPSYAEPTA